MLSALEYRFFVLTSHVPPEIIQNIFGEKYKTLFSVKVLLCQMMDAARIGDQHQEQPESMFDDPPKHIPASRPGSAKPASRATTPKLILDMLYSVDNKKTGSSKSVTWKLADKLTNNYYFEPKESLGSILLAKKLGLTK